MYPTDASPYGPSSPPSVKRTLGDAISGSGVDLGPIERLRIWVILTDADPEGERAGRTLRERARAHGVIAHRAMLTVGATLYKDASDAHVDGMAREEVRECIERALRSGASLP